MHSVLLDTALREFQEQGSHFLFKRKKIITHVGKGLGKTVMHLKGGLLAGCERFLVLCSSNAVKTWPRESKKWFPEFLPYIHQISDMSKAIRKQQWNAVPLKGPVCVVLTYQTMQSDMGLRRSNRKSLVTGEDVMSDAVIPPNLLESMEILGEDEFHKLMRNRDSTFVDLSKELVHGKRIPMANFISGSAISKGPQDIWPVLNIIDPKFFKSFWGYVYASCIVDSNGFGKQILGPDPMKAEGWRRSVAPYYFYRSKEQCAKELPPKLRHIMTLEMDPHTRRVYDELSSQQLVDWNTVHQDEDLTLDEEGQDYSGDTSIEALLAGASEKASVRDELEELPPDVDILAIKSSLASLYALRLLSICPKAVHPSLGYGEAINWVAGDIEDAESTHNVIYTPFKKPIQHFVDYLHARSRNGKGGHCLTPVYVLKGGITPERQEGIINAWRRTGGTIICTIKYAQSFELIECTTPYLIGCEWDPEENDQAEDRHNRLSASDTTHCWYTCMRGTQDEHVLDTTVTKRQNANILFKKANRDLLKLVLKPEDIGHGFDLSQVR